MNVKNYKRNKDEEVVSDEQPAAKRTKKLGTAAEKKQHGVKRHCKKKTAQAGIVGVNEAVGKQQCADVCAIGGDIAPQPDSKVIDLSKYLLLHLIMEHSFFVSIK